MQDICRRLAQHALLPLAKDATEKAIINRLDAKFGPPYTVFTTNIEKIKIEAGNLTISEKLVDELIK